MQVAKFRPFYVVDHVLKYPHDPQVFGLCYHQYLMADPQGPTIKCRCLSDLGKKSC